MQNPSAISKLNLIQDFVDRGNGMLPTQDDFLEVVDHLIETRDFKTAIHLGEAARTYYPYNLDVFLAIAEAQAQSGKFSIALETLNLAENLFPADAELLWSKARLLHFTGEFQQAINLYKSLAASMEDSAEAYSWTGKAYMALGKFEKANVAFKKAFLQDPTNGDFLFDFIESAEKANAKTSALNLLEKQTDEAPFNAHYWFNFGCALNYYQKYEKSLSAFDYALVIKEEFGEAWFEKGNVFMNQEKYPEALEAYLHAQKYEGDSPELFCCLGACFEKQEDYKNGISFFRKATELDEEYEDGWFGVGACLFKQEKWIESIHFFKKAIKINDDCDQYWLSLANAEYEAGNLFSSIEAYEKASEINPFNPQTWLNWSLVYFENDQKEKACDLINEGLEILPEDADMLYRAFAYFFACHELEKACTFLEQALVVDYSSHEMLYEFFPEIEIQKVIFRIISYLSN